MLVAEGGSLLRMDDGCFQTGSEHKEVSFYRTSLNVKKIF